MLKTQREKTILKQGLMVLGAMVALYFFVLSPFLREENTVLDEELERKTSEVKKYIARTGSLPSKEGFDKLEKEKSALEEKLQNLVDFADPEKVRMSESNTEPGLYFIDKLHGVLKKFTENTASGAAKLPENLGFGDGLPKEGMVDLLLRQLETVEFSMDTLLKSERIEFTAIKPLKSIDYIEPLSKEVFYTELPIQISIKTNTKTLIDLLLQLKNQSPIVSVKELHIKTSDLASGDIEASLVLSTFKVARKVKR